MDNNCTMVLNDEIQTSSQTFAPMEVKMMTQQLNNPTHNTIANTPRRQVMALRWDERRGVPVMVDILQGQTYALKSNDQPSQAVSQRPAA